MAERANSKKVLETAVVWANRPQIVLEGWLGDASSGFEADHNLGSKREVIEITTILETPRTQ